MRKKPENVWFSTFFKNTLLKTTDVEVLKNSNLHQKITRLSGGLPTKTIGKNFQ